MLHWGWLPAGGGPAAPRCGASASMVIGGSAPTALGTSPPAGPVQRSSISRSPGWGR